jgi:hypothetical protein
MIFKRLELNCLIIATSISLIALTIELFPYATKIIKSDLRRNTINIKQKNKKVIIVFFGGILAMIPGMIAGVWFCVDVLLPFMYGSMKIAMSSWSSSIIGILLLIILPIVGIGLSYTLVLIIIKPFVSWKTIRNLLRKEL